MQDKLVYYSNGVAGVDPDSPTQPIQGLTIHIFKQNSSGWSAVPMRKGEPYLGYKAKELTYAEYKLWELRIARASSAGSSGYQDTGGTWFTGLIGSGRSVLNGEGFSLLKEQYAKQVGHVLEKQLEASRILFKLAQLDADAIGEDHEAVFAAKHPQIGESVKAALFKEHRANPFANGKPRGPK
jgi:hypothetical protein